VLVDHSWSGREHHRRTGLIMEIGIVGLGRMGLNIAERLARGGHRVIGYDPGAEVGRALADRGVLAADSIAALSSLLEAPRTIWLMVPAEVVDTAIADVAPHLSRGDVVIDGGNSNYRETIRRSDALWERGIHFIDVGTSGGVWGLDGGYSLMIGGDRGTVEHVRPLFETLAPAPDRGWGHVGPVGAGHFTKMVHNGIEYGLMQAYAEGFAILERKEVFDLDLRQVAEIWRSGSVVRSWLLDLTASALAADPGLTTVRPYVEDSGTGRWTVAEAIDLDVPAPVITLALQARLRSRIGDSFADRMLAVMREQFGGHAVRRED
jgi:6-phosphogluconate dehydrogenase